VEGAAQPAILEPTVSQVRATVGAITVQQAEATALVAEQHEVLTHELHWLEWPGTPQFFRQSHGLPIAAQQGSGRRSGTNLGHEIILFSTDHSNAPIGQVIAFDCMQWHSLFLTQANDIKKKRQDSTVLLVNTDLICLFLNQKMAVDLKNSGFSDLCMH
jgi:hypothetical protein